MKYIINILMVSILFISINLAQEKDYSKEPGYVNFGSFSSLEKEGEGTEIFLESNILKMVSKMSDKKDSQLSDLLSGLKLIKVNTFDINHKNTAKIINRINQIDKELNDKDWSRIVKVKSKNEYTNIYVKYSPDEKAIAGLVVASLSDSGKVSFINIVGTINLETIGKLGVKFDIPSLENIHK